MEIQKQGENRPAQNDKKSPAPTGKAVARVNGIKKSKRTDKKTSASLHNLRKCNNERGIDWRKKMASKPRAYGEKRRRAEAVGHKRIMKKMPVLLRNL